MHQSEWDHISPIRNGVFWCGTAATFWKMQCCVSLHLCKGRGSGNNNNKVTTTSCVFVERQERVLMFWWHILHVSQTWGLNETEKKICWKGLQIGETAWGLEAAHLPIRGWGQSPSNRRSFLNLWSVVAPSCNGFHPTNNSYLWRLNLMYLSIPRAERSEGNEQALSSPSAIHHTSFPEGHCFFANL